MHVPLELCNIGIFCLCETDIRLEATEHTLEWIQARNQMATKFYLV